MVYVLSKVQSNNNIIHEFVWMPCAFVCITWVQNIHDLNLVSRKLQKLHAFSQCFLNIILQIPINVGNV
jgi:hypothetical protein